MNHEYEEESNGHWISMNDLLAGTLLLFILLTVNFISEIKDNKTKQSAVLTVLEQEFKKTGINVSINPENGTLELSDKILFDSNESKLKTQGENTLSIFFPILARGIAKNEDVAKEVLSISIIGFSSQKIENTEFKKKMMELSLKRSEAVWKYAIDSRNFEYKKELIQKLMIGGWGNTKAISNIDLDADRKVQFKIEFTGMYEKLKESLLREKGTQKK